MAQAKKELFDVELQDAAVIFKSLGHPARLAILRYLAATQTCITGDISDVLPLSRTTVAQHLTQLKEAGLIKGEVAGARVNYCINNDKIELLKQFASPFFESLCCNGGSDCQTDGHSDSCRINKFNL
ncbi:ArsR/SmtB family transcription factor [Alkaliflexus imshenetskii]|uniref:ArsR/SmtB family transcription factor n=1 Tax=Alkaliflexus imshenetskii TaxID=286730 RepID=UPI0004BBBB8E|nr:metalloregulator ArsR/SmtB family transcription factor [Alkaliflexus imshenetskii]